MEASAIAVIRPRLPVDLRRTLWHLRRGSGDPTMRVDATGAWWRASLTPAGPATTCLRARGGEIEVGAWGPGAGWALEAAPELVGARDDLAGFEPRGLVRELHRRLAGLRIARSRAVFEALVPTVLEQKVTGIEARASWRAMALAWGEKAPGPVARLRLPPRPGVLAAQPSSAYHAFRIEQRRANVIRQAAPRATRVDGLAALAPAEAQARLQSLPGVGAWTAAEVALVALGDADAVPVGDLHLPSMVSWALAGEPRGGDARMLELLEPYAGHRGRVLRLLAAGGLWAPRRSPRFAPRPAAIW